MAVRDKAVDRSRQGVDFRHVELPEIVFKVPWSNYNVGDKIRPVGTLREFLISHGFATLVATGKKKGRRR